MKYIDFYFQDRRRVFLDLRNVNIKNKNIRPDIIMLGDSITERFNLNYYGITNKIVLNSGIDGDQLLLIRHRLETDVISFKPKQVLFMAGVNDIMNSGLAHKDSYEKFIISLFEEFKFIVQELKNKNIDVICCGVIKISTHDHNFMFLNFVIEKYNEMIEEYCSSNEITFINYNKVLENKYEMMDNSFVDDGLHPNEKGYLEMYKYLETKGVL